eukprot:m.83647 g.83647  ORF g.83647 m.83647 type:complete len:391 (+) comp12931_c0_seq4:3719-4891(+)
MFFAGLLEHIANASFTSRGFATLMHTGLATANNLFTKGDSVGFRNYLAPVNVVVLSDGETLNFADVERELAKETMQATRRIAVDIDYDDEKDNTQYKQISGNDGVFITGNCADVSALIDKTYDALVNLPDRIPCPTVTDTVETTSSTVTTHTSTTISTKSVTHTTSSKSTTLTVTKTTNTISATSVTTETGTTLTLTTPTATSMTTVSATMLTTTIPVETTTTTVTTSTVTTATGTQTSISTVTTSDTMTSSTVSNTTQTQTTLTTITVTSTSTSRTTSVTGTSSTTTSTKQTTYSITCSPNCKSCDNGGKCTECTNSFYLLTLETTATCVETCPTGFDGTGDETDGRRCFTPCEDVFTNCATLVQGGYCLSSPDFMQEFCKRSCGTIEC